MLSGIVPASGRFVELPVQKPVNEARVDRFGSSVVFATVVAASCPVIGEGVSCEMARRLSRQWLGTRVPFANYLGALLTGLETIHPSQLYPNGDKLSPQGDTLSPKSLVSHAVARHRSLASRVQRFGQ
jgi:hypothetical protein